MPALVAASCRTSYRTFFQPLRVRILLPIWLLLTWSGSIRCDIRLMILKLLLIFLALPEWFFFEAVDFLWSVASLFSLKPCQFLTVAWGWLEDAGFAIHTVRFSWFGPLFIDLRTWISPLYGWVDQVEALSKEKNSLFFNPDCIYVNRQTSS